MAENEIIKINSEKLNNTERIKSTLSLVNEAVFAAANTVANYQDSHDREK